MGFSLFIIDLRAKFIEKCVDIYICMIVVKHIYRAGKDIRFIGAWSCVKPGCFKVFLVVCVCQALVHTAHRTHSHCMVDMHVICV